MIIIFLFCLHYKWFVLDNNHYFVCVVQINPMLWGQNVPTKKAVSEILDLVGYFFFYDKKNIRIWLWGVVFLQYKTHCSYGMSL